MLSIIFSCSSTNISESNEGPGLPSEEREEGGQGGFQDQKIVVHIYVFVLANVLYLTLSSIGT